MACHVKEHIDQIPSLGEVSPSPESGSFFLDISGHPNHPNVLLNSWCFSNLTFGFPKVHVRYMLE